MRVNARAARLRKIDATLLGCGTEWQTFNAICLMLGVPEGGHIRADYRSRLALLIAAGKIERRGRQVNVEYRIAGVPE